MQAIQVKGVKAVQSQLLLLIHQRSFRWISVNQSREIYLFFDFLVVRGLNGNGFKHGFNLATEFNDFKGIVATGIAKARFLRRL